MRRCDRFNSTTICTVSSVSFHHRQQNYAKLSCSSRNQQKNKKEGFGLFFIFTSKPMCISGASSVVQLIEVTRWWRALWKWLAACWPMNSSKTRFLGVESNESFSKMSYFSQFILISLTYLITKHAGANQKHTASMTTVNNTQNKMEREFFWRGIE